MDQHLQTQLEKLRKYLLKQHLTIAVAESVTGGIIQAALSSLEEASFFFQGGITAYNLGQKTRHLWVDPIHAERHNCVSERVSQQMALGVSRLFLSDIGISITGYAAPLPEKGITSPFAFYTLCHNGEILDHAELRTDKHDFVKAQQDYMVQVLIKVTEKLTGRA